MAFVVAKNRVTSLVREGKVDRMATLVISIANEFLDVLPMFFSAGSKSVVQGNCSSAPIT